MKFKFMYRYFMRDLVDAEVVNIGDMEMMDGVLISPCEGDICTSGI